MKVWDSLPTALREEKARVPRISIWGLKGRGKWRLAWMTLAMGGSREARALLHKITEKKRWVEPRNRWARG
jgi:hypothetical protein